LKTLLASATIVIAPTAVKVIRLWIDTRRVTDELSRRTLNIIACAPERPATRIVAVHLAVAIVIDAVVATLGVIVVGTAFATGSINRDARMKTYAFLARSRDALFNTWFIASELFCRALGATRKACGAGDG